MRKRVPRDEIPTVIEFITNREYLGLSISLAQDTLLRASYGLPLESDEALTLFRQCTGRATYAPPENGWGEITVVAGARSGKDSRVAVPIALYEAIYGGHEVSEGEIGVVPLVAQNEKATRTAYMYAKGYALNHPRISQYVDSDPAGALVLRSATGHPMRLECFSCTGAAVRGFSIVAAVMDEVGFYRTRSGAPLDAEMQEAIRRGMVNFRSGGRTRLVKISTPGIGGKTGVLWDDFDRYFGSESPDVLVWHAGTTLMNPSITEEHLAEDRRKNPLVAKREYDAEFITSPEGAFLPWVWVEAATMPRVYAIEPQRAPRYVAGVDPSGAGADEFAAAIAHVEDGTRIVVDWVDGWKSSRQGSIDLSAVVKEIADQLKRYRVATVRGDHYAAQWVPQEFAKHGIRYEATDQDKSRCYRDCVAFFQETGRLKLPDDGILLGQFGGLEVVTEKRGGGVPRVDHPKGAHDDRANAVAIAISELAKSMAPAVGLTEGALAARQAALAPVDSPARIAGWAAQQGLLPSRPGTTRFWGERPAPVRMFR